MNKPKLVIFDFSGTLAYFEKIDPAKLIPDLAKQGLKIKGEKEVKSFYQLFGSAITDSKDWSDFSGKILNGLSLGSEEKMIKNLADFFKTKYGPKIYRDGEEIIKLPFQKAILSTGSRFLIKETFPEGFEIFSPEETKFVKPDPRAFLSVLGKLRKKPEEALMVGDEPERDLIPASGLGMATILIDRENKIKNYSGIKINSLKEIKSILGL